MILCNAFAGVGSLFASVVLVDFRALVAELVCCCIDLMFLCLFV
jgi:hypothetical protein